MVKVEVINVRDNGDYLTATLKFDFGVEGTVDIPIDSDVSNLKKILFEEYNKYREKQAKKRALLSYLKGTLEIVEDEFKKFTEEIQKEAEETISEAKSITESIAEKIKQTVETPAIQGVTEKANELLTSLKDKLGNLSIQDIDIVKNIVKLMSERPDIKSMISETINKLRKSETNELSEDPNEEISEPSDNFPWK